MSEGQVVARLDEEIIVDSWMSKIVDDCSQIARQDGDTFQLHILKQSIGDEQVHVLQNVCRMRPVAKLLSL